MKKRIRTNSSLLKSAKKPIRMKTISEPNSKKNIMSAQVSCFSVENGLDFGIFPDQIYL